MSYVSSVFAWFLILVMLNRLLKNDIIKNNWVTLDTERINKSPYIYAFGVFCGVIPVVREIIALMILSGAIVKK